MHMSLAGTNLSNEQSEIGRVIFATVTLRDGMDTERSIRFMVPMHAQKRKGAFHEPDLAIRPRRGATI
jgi:hypothetical protein